MRDGAGDHFAVLQQRQQDRARRFDGMQQTVGQRASNADGRIVEEADQRGVEGGVLVGRAGVQQVGLGSQVRRLPALLAVAGTAQGDEVLIRNHKSLRTAENDRNGQDLRNGSP